MLTSLTPSTCQLMNTFALAAPAFLVDKVLKVVVNFHSLTYELVHIPVQVLRINYVNNYVSSPHGGTSSSLVRKIVQRMSALCSSS